MYITAHREALLSNRHSLGLFLLQFGLTAVHLVNLQNIDEKGNSSACPTMKPVPLVLLLAFLLTSHVRPGVCRPRRLPGLFDGTGGRFKSQLDEVLLRAAGDNAVSYLLGEKILRFLQRNPRVRSLNHLPLLPYDYEGVARTTTQLDSQALAHLARSLTQLDAEEGVVGEEGDRELLLAKRNDDPPISIDLTFHLLRNMIEMAKIESQKEQAELNRKFLEEVGK